MIFWKKKETTEEDKNRYADIATRLFASMLDLALIYMFVNAFSQLLFNAAYPEGSEYVRIHSQIVNEYPHLATEPGKMTLLIATKYPESMTLILNQLGFNAVVQMLLVGLYYIPLTKIYGATLGKRLMGLKVIDGITNKDITWSQAIVRYIGYIPTVLVVGLGILTGMINRRHRCWHDMLADTVVIRVENRWYTKYVNKVKAYFNLDVKK